VPGARGTCDGMTGRLTLPWCRGEIVLTVWLPERFPLAGWRLRVGPQGIDVRDLIPVEGIGERSGAKTVDIDLASDQPARRLRGGLS
jgi:hypothetical protein